MAKVNPLGILPKPNIRRQLHVSALEMLSKCGILFEYVYVKGRRRPPGIFTLVGTSTHRTIHHDLRNKIETGELVSDSEIKDTASKLFDDTLEKERVEPTEEDLEAGLTLVNAKDKAIGLAMLHHNALAPKLHPTKVERPFSLSLDDYLKDKEKQLREARKHVSGYAKDLYSRMATAHHVIARDGCDLAGQQDVKEEFPTPFQELRTDRTDWTFADDTLHVRDTKTTGKSPNVLAADHSLQLAAYALASNVLDKRLPDKMFLDYLVETPKRHERYVKSVYTVPSQDDVDMFLARVSNAVYALHSGVFVPARTDDWWCSKRWCGFWEECPYAKRPTSSKPLVQIKGV